MGSGVVLTAVEAVGGDLRVHFCCCVIGRQGVGDGRGDLGLRPVLGHVQGIDGPRHHGVDLGLREGFGLQVGVALEPGEVQVAQHVAALQHLPGGRVGAPGRRVAEGHRHQGRGDRGVRLGAGVIRAQIDPGDRGGDGGVHLRGGWRCWFRRWCSTRPAWPAPSSRRPWAPAGRPPRPCCSCRRPGSA